MASLSAVLGVITSAGERVDKALRQAGGYLPTWIKLGTGLSASAAKNGQAVEITLSIDSAASVTFAAVKAALALANSAIAVNSQKITGLATGTANGDAVNVAQVAAAYVPFVATGLTAGGGTVNLSDTSSIYGARSGGTTATAPLIRWASDDLTIGSGDASTVDNLVMEARLAVNVAGYITITKGSTGMSLGGAGLKVGLYDATPIVQASRVGQLTDSTGGSATTTLGAGIVDTVAKDAIASLAAKVNALEARLSAAAGGIGVTA